MENGLALLGYILTLFLGYIIGYYFIRRLERNNTYSFFAAITMPWLIVFCACLIGFLVATFFTVVMLPFLLISSSIGGLIAHRKKVSTKSISS
jgi:hypothetical protein